jgi:ABC-type proline/glycine betaine transport system ATPase subunit
LVRLLGEVHAVGGIQAGDISQLVLLVLEAGKVHEAGEVLQVLKAPQDVQVNQVVQVVQESQVVQVFQVSQVVQESQAVQVFQVSQVAQESQVVQVFQVNQAVQENQVVQVLEVFQAVQENQVVQVLEVFQVVPSQAVLSQAAEALVTVPHDLPPVQLVVEDAQLVDQSAAADAPLVVVVDTHRRSIGSHRRRKHFNSSRFLWQAINSSVQISVIVLSELGHLGCYRWRFKGVVHSN